ncbi:MAG: ferrous iron transport protein B, partial [Mailhella sp.]
MSYFHHADTGAPRSSLPTLALAGNPNAGKTTAFNALTGARQHVGNYPGITVEQKEGIAHCDGESIRIIDLPGAYSLTAYTQEERVARRVVGTERPLAVMALLNAGALERNLYLAVQLMEMGVPVSIGLNMMDEARAMGMTIDVAELSSRLKVPVVETVARTGDGLQEYLHKTMEFSRKYEGLPWKPLHISYGPDLDPVLEHLTESLDEEGIGCAPYPTRWLALKLLENDEEILSELSHDNAEVMAHVKSHIDEVEAHLKATLGTSAEAIIADYRYGYISSLLRGVLKRQDDIARRMDFSDRADRILTHQLFGPLIMLGIMYLMYRITFTLGEIPMQWVEAFFGWMRNIVDGAMDDGVLKSMITSGVIDGVGGVMCFVPLILLIFMQIAILEDSGYMARMAYMLDRIFRIFGLHGASVVPYILGGGIAGGCAVPGIMAARTLRSPREKLATLLTVPFMACGAKLPVFIVFSGVFFPGNEALVMFGLTLTGWIVAMLAARALRSSFIKGPATPFVMELPPYRMPTVQGMVIHAGERTWEYLKKAGTVILAISIVVWAAMTYPGLSADKVQQHEAVLAELYARKEAAGMDVSKIRTLDQAIVQENGKFSEETLRH